MADDVSASGDVSASDDMEENILYDLTIAAEWPQEPETVSRNIKEKSQISLAGRLSSVAYRTLWTFLRSIGIAVRTVSPCVLPPELVKLVSSHINWHLDVSSDGRNLAVLQDHYLEIRSSRDDFTAPVCRCLVGVDPYPQWRRVVWSCSGDMVACSQSTGAVHVFDVVGTNIVQIPSTVPLNPNSPVDLSHAVVALIFKEYKGTDDTCVWHEELLVINYQGALHSYLISLEGTICLNHTYNFSVSYPRGLSSALYLPQHAILVLGGTTSATGGSPTSTPTSAMSSGVTSRSDFGLTLWRALSDMPHYKMVTDYEEDVRADGIFCMSVSPDDRMVAAVHYTGAVSVWHVPSFRPAAIWPLEEQPGYDETNPEIVDNPRRKKQMKDFLTSFHLMDANWWSEEAVILARGTGALSVSSIRTLRNLLGTSPEWFEPAPVVSPAIDGGFMALECESKFSSLKRRQIDEEDNDFEDSDDELDATLVTKTTRHIKWLLHYVTDIERFQPPRKRPKVVTRTYRLINMKSTTPEELYHRKIELEEYGEALALAKVYGLDCDLVYQRQWRKTPVSVASIQDYLSKISKRSWVLNDCMERVPENIDAMRELLQYGLRGTDLEALIAIGKREDGGRFILCDTAAAYEESLDYLDEDALEEAKEREAEERQALAATVDFSKLNLEQRELCRARVKLLQYLDRLATYEEILGGIHAAEERFDPKFFEDFRSKNIVELALNYARQCDWRALEVLLTYHGSELLDHRLAILSNFPETFAPEEYRSLLPEAGSSTDDPEVLPWEESLWRREDWVEMDRCRSAIDPDPQDPSAFLYEENPDLEQFRGSILTHTQLSDWYNYRAMEIERQARQVEHAVELVRYGMEHYVQDLEHLCDDLVTMDTLVYECHVDDELTFEELRAMEDIDKLRLMMSQSADEMYPKNVRRWMVPFLRRCEKHVPGSFDELLRRYLVTLAVDNLFYCRKVFESSKADQPNPVISDDNELISMALECIYTCESNNQLSNAFGILECLPQRGFGVVSEASSKLHNQVDELECHLSAAEILETHNLPQTIASIRDTQNDPEEVKKLFTKLTRRAGCQTPPLTSAQWKDLLFAMLDLRDKAYRCIQPSVCYEIFVESLLCSSRPENIQLASEMIERSAAEASEPDYPAGDADHLPLIHKVAYPRAVQLVLSAAQEYFNSSAALTDPCMELARQCLNLVSDQPVAVSEELDLIESLSLLDGFGVAMLPLQVRMTTDRAKLIQRAIDAKPYTYRNSQRLLRLARLLRVKGNSSKEREGTVLKLVAQAALKVKDSRVALETCEQLMAKGYPPIWEECKELAQQDSFTDFKAKVDLLSFALTHCTEDMVDPILRAKCLLETQILYEHLEKAGSPHSRGSVSPPGSGRERSPEGRASSSFSPQEALRQTQEILSATTHTTRTVLSAVSDRQWWRHTMGALRPLTTGGAGSSSGSEEWDGRNADMSRQGCHPFYGTHIEKAYTNNVEADYRRLNLPPGGVNGLQFSEAILRMSSLEQLLTDTETHPSATNVLLQLAEDTIHQDCTLALAYLLALPNPLDAETVFNKLPRTAVSLQLATYYYALQLAVRLGAQARTDCTKVGLSTERTSTKKASTKVRGSIKTKTAATGAGSSTSECSTTETGASASEAKAEAVSELYIHDPAAVVDTLVALVGEDGSGLQALVDDTLPPGMEDLAQRLHAHHEVMTDFNQAQVLERLSKGVDVARFTQDDEYKRETILGLAMTTEQSVYETAVSLAKRYKLPFWEIYMTHLEYLFESGLPTSQMAERVNKEGLLHALQEQPEKFAGRMAQYVYPGLAGTDHGRLLYYYTLLSDVAEGAEGSTRAANEQLSKADLHVRLLKKIKQAAPGLDYKKLMDGPERPLEVIRPILHDGNVHVLAKLAPKIPDQHGGFLQPSLVFCAWAVKMFWNTESRTKQPPQTKMEWIHRYEACHEYIQKLSPDDMIQFVEAIIFVPQALDKLGLECRQEIVKRALKYSKQGGKKKKREENARSEATWEDVSVSMQQALDHLNNLDNPVIEKLASSQDARHQQYARLYDLTRSETDKVHELCIRMTLDGQPCALVAEVLGIVEGERWGPQTVIREALTLLIDTIRKPESELPPLLEGRDLMQTLSTIVQRIHDDQGESDLVSADDVMTLLRPFCADVSVAVQPRLEVLRILEQAFDLNQDDLVLLVRYRTDALISVDWPDKKLREDEVSTDEGRQLLFEELLASSAHLSQYKALSQLLVVWPPLQAQEEKSEDPEHHPWCQLLVAMATQCREEAVPQLLDVMKNLKEKSPLSLQCVRFLFTNLVSNGMPLVAVKCALISGHAELHEDIIAQIVELNTVSEDPELSRLLLQHHLGARIVNTAYYPLLVDYVISQQTPGEEMPYYLNVETIANQLQDLGHEVEAGSLLMTYRGTHPMLRTFDMTFGVLSRWFTR